MQLEFTAQKRLLHGEIVPVRDVKTGEAKSRDTDVEFEVTVKPEEKEGQRPRLIVVAGSTSVKPPNAAPPPAAGQPPPPGAPPAPPPPQGGKLKFNIPVRLPHRRGCLLSRWIQYLLASRRQAAPLPLPPAGKPAKPLKEAPGRQAEEKKAKERSESAEERQSSDDSKKE